MAGYMLEEIWYMGLCAIFKKIKFNFKQVNITSFILKIH